MLKKRLFIALAFIFAAICSIGATRSIRSSRIVAEEEIVELADEKTGYVVISEVEHGTITANIENGKVGEIVTLTITPNTLYVVSSIKANGLDLIASESGVFSFALAEGENKIEAVFVLDNEAVALVNEVIEDAKGGKWDEIFSLDNALLAVNYIINSGLGFALVALFKKYKKSGSIDRKEIIEAVQKSIPEQADAIISDLINEKLIPSITPMLDKVDKVEDAMKTFIQAFLYSLDDTMEAKNEIVSLLSNVKLSDSSTIEAFRKLFQDEIAKIKSEYDEKIKLLDSLKNTQEKINTVKILEKEAETSGSAVEEGSYDGTSI